MLENTEAVIFDMDGTLVDSMGIWQDIDVDYLAGFGLTVPKDLHQEVGGKSFHETAVYFKERFQLADSVEEIEKSWNDMALQAYMYQVPFKDGVLEFLEHLKKKGIKVGIATSNSRQLVESLLLSRGIADYFHAVCTGCEVPKGKPEPDVYLKAASMLQAVPERCLVFEDIVQGIVAGKSAGMRVCAIEDAYSMEQTEEKQEMADYYIRNYYELLEGLTE